MFHAPKRGGVGLRAIRAFGVALCLALAVAGLPDAAAQAPEAAPSLSSPQPEGAGWRLTWTTEAGREYRLERSTDLMEWLEVRTLTAAGASESAFDSPPGEVGAVFWRVQRLGDSGGTVISEIVPAFSPGGSGNDAGLTIEISGGDPVQSVRFFDGVTLLGEALPGLGNDWTFTLDVDPAGPVVRQLSLQVTTDSGEVIATEPVGVLVADPSQFVAGRLVAGAGPAEFSPVPGEFIAVGADGTLAPFFYFPEGRAATPKLTGAHFAFPEGGTLSEEAGEFVVTFAHAEFFRAGVDLFPVPSLAGPRQLVVGAVTSAAVAGAFATGAAGPQLLWSVVPVDWLDGTLSPAGWAAHRVRLPIGDFELPGSQTSAAVTIDPGSGEASLLVCHHGAWSPASGGPVFRVPEGDPLKIYLDTRGGIRAHGTAEAEFPDGATVRGSLAWRHPNFEFRFEGKGIVIPALSGLNTVLPDAPENCVTSLPANPTAAELDAAAACLAGMRDSFRGLALGGVAQADPAQSDAFAPLSSPTDQAGPALAAWAGRIVSWGADRAGQPLGDALGHELAGVIQHAGKSAAGAHDLPSALKVLRNLADIQRQLGSVAVGPETDAVRAALGAALTQAVAAAGRIIEARPEYDGDEETQAAVALLTEVIDRLPETPAPAPLREPRVDRGSAPPSDAELRDQVFRISLGLKARVAFRLFSDVQVTKGDFRQDNPVLAAKSLTQLFRFLDTVEMVFDLLRQTDRELPAANAPADFPVLEALLQCQPFLVARHNEEAARAFTRQDAALAAKVLNDRGRIFALYKKFGAPLSSDAGLYAPRLDDFVAQYEPLLAQALAPLEPGARIDGYTAYIIGLQLIGDSVSDPSALDAIVAASLDRMTSINNSLASLLAGDPKCSALEQELIARGEVVMSAPLGFEGQQVPPISGKYESIADSGLARTLQVNAGGRLFTAQLQFHNPGAPLHRFLLRGLLARETADTAEYSYLRIDPATQRIVTTGILTAAISNGATVISLRDRAGSLSVFARASTFPAYSERLAGLFTGEAGELLRAQRDAPLHSRQADLVAQAAEDMKALIRDSIRSGAASADKLLAATAINALVRDTRDRLAAEHLVLFRHIARIHLSGSKPSDDEPAIDDSGLSYHNWLMFLFNERRPQMPDTADLLGLVPDSIDPSTLFTYDVQVITTIVGGEVGPVGAGGGVMTVTVNKTTPTGEASNFSVIGPLGQVGIGPGLGFTAVISNDNFTFKSPFNYLPEDFAGPVSTTGGSATLALGPGVQISLGAVVMFGSGRLPPVSYQPDIVDGVLGLGVGAGIDQGFGALLPASVFLASEELHLTGDFSPLSYSASEQALFDTSVDFEVDSAIINECGWQNFREFIAEFRAIFASPTAQVLVVGMTDTTAGAPHNLTLSQDRAHSVRAALLAIMGPFDVLPDDRVVAVGVGELAANRDVPLSAFPNKAVRTLVEFLRTQNPTIADGIDDPEWRRVVVIINDLVTTQVGNPKDIVIP